MGSIVEIEKLDEELMALISYCVFDQSTDRIEKIYSEYSNSDDRNLFGYYIEGTIAGFIGVEILMEKTIISHIAVCPMYRLKGVGKSLIMYVNSLSEDKSIEAETDDEAVDFYSRIGFRIEEVDSYKGMRRYRCNMNL